MVENGGDNDPEYEQFLRQLKVHDKSYVLETENDGVLRLIKYEAEVDLKDEQIICPECGPVVNQTLVVKNEHAQSTLNYNVGIQYQARLVDKKVLEGDMVVVDELIEIDRDNFYQNKKKIGVCANVDHEMIKRDVFHTHGKQLFQDFDIKNEFDPYLEREGIIQGQITSLKCANCSITFKMIDGKHLLEEEDKSEMEILGIAAFGEKGITCPFVSSKKFHISMVEDEFSEPRDVASDQFRAEVLSVLRKPFDKEEYTRYRKEIKDGSYLDHHSDLKRKLKKYRYKKEKCMIFLRGFFYWLQNLTREGAFQPWTDQECLAVEPTSTSS